MNTSKLSDWMQILASVGVLVGILLIFVEIRQNTELGRAEHVAGAYEMWASIAQIELQSDINELFVKSIEQPDALSISEMMDLSSWLVNVIAIYQRQTTLYQLGLASDPKAGLRDAARYYFSGRFGRAWFEANKEWIGMTPVVYETIRDEIESTPIQTKFEYMDRIKSQL